MKRKMEVEQDSSPFLSYTNVREQKTYTLIVNGEIVDPNDFVDHVYLIDQAEEQDEICIKLNSGGGSFSAVDYLLHALAKTPAHIHVEGTGIVASAATLILLTADSFELSPNTDLLIHNCEWGYSGKHSDNMEYAKFADKQNTKILHDFYDGMFTQEEFEQLKSGKQFWMDVEEFVERFERRMKFLEDQDKPNTQGEAHEDCE